MNLMYNSFDSEQNIVLWGLHTFQYIDTVLNKILKSTIYGFISTHVKSNQKKPIDF